jgi:glucose/arabinose dehydrogenase/plastocyanin
MLSLHAANVTVLMQGFSFQPASKTINVGDSVTWTQTDSGTTHTTTSGNPGSADGKWTSGFLTTGQSFTETFNTAGSFPYFCIPHSSFMSGTIIVQGQAAQPPVVSITSPANNTSFPAAPATLNIQATATVAGSTITSVEFFDGSVSLGSATAQPFSITATLNAGAHTLTAKATAANGLSATSTGVNVTVLTAAAPVVAITSPVNNAVLPAPGPVTITVDATVTGSTIEMVEYFDGGVFLDMSHADPWSITANLAAGSHSLTAKATAANGQTATSAPVTVTVNAGGTKITDPLPSIASTDLTIDLQPILDGLVSPLGMAVPDDGSGRLFVYDQIGLIHVLQNGTNLDTPLLDVQSRLVPLSAGYDERGLLGVATHPDFAQDPFIYTYTSEPTAGLADFPVEPNPGTTNNHQSVIAEWKIDPANPDRIDLASRREILRIDEPESNHNAGTMHFGPDGFLYVTLGDGGAADDQGSGHLPDTGNAQNINRILGKMIRIDIDGRTSPNSQYAVPADNPFVGVDGLDEIYAYGFRNPYTWSFDQMTGEIYVGDVGQNDVEELDRVFKGGNYGWHIKEGTFYFDPNGTDAGFVTTLPVTTVPPNLIDPIAEYDHQDGLAIVGGYVYYGTKIPSLVGRYVTGDLGTFSAPAGRLLYLNGGVFKELRLGVDGHPLNLWIKGFGQDTDGEIYLFASGKLGPSGVEGKMFKLVSATNTIQLTTITPDGTNLVVNWDGGVGPFLLETKDSLDNPSWRTVAGSGTNTVTVGATGETGFYRIVDMAGNRSTPFTVYMTAAAERPNPVNNPDGLGTGTLVLEGNTLTFDIHYSGLTGVATLAHIHSPATAAGFAGVAINLQPYNGGTFSTQGVLSGSVQLTPQQKADILAGKAYVNIHTSANPSGEIRGQIAPVLFEANLGGQNERPQIDTTGRGTATFMLVGNQLTFNLEYSELSSLATLAHIHGPATLDTSAGIMINLAPFNGGAFGTNGTLSGTVTLDPSQLASLVDGLTYVNIHTAINPGGEIRGQILPKAAAIPFTASMSGAAEKPDAVTSTGTGSGTFALEGNNLTFNITYTGLSGTATLAHIHGPASASQAAGVLINLAPYNGGAFGTAGTLSGTVALTDLQRAYLLEGKLYANIHTAAHPSGEIRGQIAPVLFQANLSGAAERPNALQTSGTGHASFLLVGDQLTVSATYSGLSSDAIAAHIHGASDTSGSTGIMINLGNLNGGAFGPSGAFAGTVTAQPDQITAIVDELTYMNIHTTINSAGEIRGQLTH